MSTASLKTAFSQHIMAQSATAMEKVGTIRITEDGRRFRYSKAGGTLAAGKAVVCAAANAHHINETPTATAVGSRTVTIAVAGAVAEDHYAGGYLQTNDANGEGWQYRIQNNSYLAGAGNVVVTLEDPIKDALTTSSEVSLIANPGMDVNHTTTEENVFAGICPCDVTDDYYFWAQIGGPAIALISGTPAVGSMLTLSDTSGALEAINSTLDVDQPIVGVLWSTVGVDGEYKPVMLFNM